MHGDTSANGVRKLQKVLMVPDTRSVSWCPMNELANHSPLCPAATSAVHFSMAHLQPWRSAQQLRRGSE